MQIRLERPADAAAVHALLERAFGGPGEAALVEALREAGAVTLALVAEEDGEVVGHVLFSPVRIDRDTGRETAIGLAPLAVIPERQRSGVGAALTRAGLALLTDAGYGAVVVLGHREYYPRFGFEPASRFGLRWEVPGHDEAFMALELRKGALGAGGGDVRYHAAFGAV